jgi:hypothetical protein
VAASGRFRRFQFPPPKATPLINLDLDLRWLLRADGPKYLELTNYVEMLKLKAHQMAIHLSCQYRLSPTPGPSIIGGKTNRMNRVDVEWFWYNFDQSIYHDISNILILWLWNDVFVIIAVFLIILDHLGFITIFTMKPLGLGSCTMQQCSQLGLASETSWLPQSHLGS